MLKRLYEYLYGVNDKYMVAYDIKLERLFLIYIIYLAIILVIGLITYFLLKNKKGKSAMKPIRFFVLLGAFSGFAILVNFIINYGVMLDYTRPKTSNYDIIFDFIRQRANRVNKGEWSREIFEVLSYIPIGIMFAFKKKERENKLAIVNAIIYATALSGITELICNCMTFSAFFYQTVICNIFGAVIGFFVLGAFRYLFVKKSFSFKKGIMRTMPLGLGVLYFALSYLLYYRYPYGNLYPNYYRRIQEHVNVEVDDSVMLSEEEVVQPASTIISTDELRDTAEKYFSLYGKEIDDTIYKVVPNYDKRGKNKYEWDIVWTDSEEKLIFIANPRGFIFYNMAYYGDDYFEDDRNGASEQFIHLSDEETRKVLKKYNVNMVGEIQPLSPESGDENTFSCLVDKEIEDGYLCRYLMGCQFVNDGELARLTLLTSIYMDNQSVYLASPKQAYDKLCQGECYAEGLYEASQNGDVTITVKDYRLEVQRDNFGCLQYVYRFNIEPITAPDGTKIDRVFVPAMKSYYE